MYGHRLGQFECVAGKGFTAELTSDDGLVLSDEGMVDDVLDNSCGGTDCKSCRQEPRGPPGGEGTTQELIRRDRSMGKR